MMVLVVISQWELGHQVNLISEAEVYALYSSIPPLSAISMETVGEPQDCVSIQ